MTEANNHKMVRKLASSSTAKLTTFGMFISSAGFLLSLFGGAEYVLKGKAALLAGPGVMFVFGIVVDLIGWFSKNDTDSCEKVDATYIIFAVIIYTSCVIYSIFFI